MKLNNNWVFIAYYIYAVSIIFGTGYVVFFLNKSGFWFLFCLILLMQSPSIETKNNSKNK